MIKRSFLIVTVLLLSVHNVFGMTPNTIIGIVTDGSSTFNLPSYPAITPDGTKAYVSNFYGNSVSVIDVATDTVTGIVTDGSSTFNGPFTIAITPDSTKAYVVN